MPYTIPEEEVRARILAFVTSILRRTQLCNGTVLHLIEDQNGEIGRDNQPCSEFAIALVQFQLEPDGELMYAGVLLDHVNEWPINAALTNDHYLVRDDSVFDQEIIGQRFDEDGNISVSLMKATNGKASVVLIIQKGVDAGNIYHAPDKRPHLLVAV